MVSYTMELGKPYCLEMFFLFFIFYFYSNKFVQRHRSYKKIAL